MRTISLESGFESWREQARRLLAAAVPPEEILWTDAAQETSLFLHEETTPYAVTTPPPKVSAAFMDMARTVAAHSDPRRWAVLYRMLWRQTHGGEKHLLGMTTDSDVRLAQQWCKTIARDIHKMHAFVRFRLVGVDEATGREQFVAWFEPEHRIVRLAISYFHKRFVGMDWSILTPMECAHWDGEKLHFTPGVERGAAPDEDALDDLWRTYYRSIFNPARLKTRAMQSEMPKKYWENLPEASIIAGLIADSQTRTHHMLQTPERDVKPAPNNPYLASLHARNAEEDKAD
jgi:probable DNA metabolism protein